MSSTAMIVAVDKIETALIKRLPRMESLVPSHINANRIISSVIVRVGNDPKLAECEVGSIITCALQCCQYGLEPDTPLQQCHLIPYKKQAKVIIGYRGFATLAYNTGEVSDIHTNVVYWDDEYRLDFNTDGFDFYHRPNHTGDRSEDKIRLFYSRLFYRDPIIKPRMNEMLLEDVKKIQNKAPGSGKDDSPWKNHFVAMGNKTVFKNSMKGAPLSPEKSGLFYQAVQDDNAVEAGKPVVLTEEARKILNADFEEEPKTESKKMAAEQSEETPIADKDNPDIFSEDNHG